MPVKIRHMMIKKSEIGCVKKDILFIYRIANIAINEREANTHTKGTAERKKQSVGWLNGLVGGITFSED